MEGKINNGGILEIKRGKNYVKQDCLEQPDGRYCSDHCPQFGEPEFVSPFKANIGVTMVLRICQGRILDFEKFTDER